MAAAVICGADLHCWVFMCCNVDSLHERYKEERGEKKEEEEPECLTSAARWEVDRTVIINDYQAVATILLGNYNKTATGNKDGSCRPSLKTKSIPTSPQPAQTQVI